MSDEERTRAWQTHLFLCLEVNGRVEIVRTEGTTHCGCIDGVTPLEGIFQLLVKGRGVRTNFGVHRVERHLPSSKTK